MASALPYFPNPRYQLLRLLGEGGFGAVFLARDLFMRSNVAIKLLRATSFDAGDRFRRELRLLQTQINNRHVVTVLDADLDADPPYIVLEFCEHGSLRSWVQQRRSWREVAAAIAHALFGLRGVHDVGGFHRDLKPDNLLLATDVATGEAIVKVADFGLARVPLTATGAMTYGGRGTLGYIAPEVLLGRPFTAAADVYSLGIVALELLTGSIDPSQQIPGAVPEGLSRLVRQMLAFEPTGRPTPQAIAQSLNALLIQGSAPAASQPRQLPSNTAGAGGGLLLAFGLAAAAALAAFAGGDNKEWDKNVGRYRGSDGRFTR